ncbi:MAG: hypothetical protein LBT74_01480 [Acidobacteriota bacterium]|nr:hypothetical protein [Acidobacteriota bacterium]
MPIVISSSPAGMAASRWPIPQASGGDSQRNQVVAHETGRALHMHHNHEKDLTTNIDGMDKTDTDFWDGSRLIALDARTRP